MNKTIKIKYGLGKKKLLKGLAIFGLSASSVVNTSCVEHDEGGNEQPVNVTFDINTLEDFELARGQVRSDKRQYTAIVRQDLAIDSMGMAKPLAEWNRLDESRDNVTTHWNDHGVYAKVKRTKLTAADYTNAGAPQIKENPKNGAYPYAATAQDSLEFKRDFDVDMKVYNQQTMSVETFGNVLNSLLGNTGPNGEIIIDIPEIIDVNNENAAVLEVLMDAINSNPNIEVEMMEFAAATDSVGVNGSLIPKMETANAKITKNGAGAFFLGEVNDAEKLRSVLVGNAKVRTHESVNFANTDVAIPNKVIYTSNPTRSGAGTTDFSEGVKSLPTRDPSWKTSTYSMEGENGAPLVIDNVRDETVLGRIAQPSVNGTKEYPNPDIHLKDDPFYGKIFLDQTQTWSDSTGFAIKQRVNGSLQAAAKLGMNTRSNNATKLVFSETYYQSQRENDLHGKVSLSYTEQNRVEVKDAAGNTSKVTLVDATKGGLPYGNPIFDEYGEYETVPYKLDAREYCFVLPAGFPLKEDNGDPHVQIENDRMVLGYISNGTTHIDFKKRYVNNSGVGTLPGRKSVYWITAEEYAEYVRQGKASR
ncbi:hypothetical protein LJC18_00190 [Lachnospiraceae bacterium OttesenSCG-928-E19]|nr:hypothetical protein [Lachnospiraceae bacterium OttesenSCG-928-E19]